jgi:hypothetical protein
MNERMCLFRRLLELRREHTAASNAWLVLDSGSIPAHRIHRRMLSLRRRIAAVLRELEVMP